MQTIMSLIMCLLFKNANTYLRNWHSSKYGGVFADE